MRRATLLPFLLALIFSGIISCNQHHDHHPSAETTDSQQFLPPEWAVNANIYEVNIRQYSPEGTFSAFTEDLPRLQEMGVRILWLMPIHPIGEENRKGTLGSYYSIRDYTAINPEFGDKNDFAELVSAAQDLGMKVILDWVANHTAWDAVWTETNPEFYLTDEDGSFFPPVDDWEDVIQLDVDNRDMWEAMIQAMEYWVNEYNIDGFRADVAYMVPTEFWITARERLEQIKPVFMLAEAEEPELHQAFDMSYTWELAQTMRDFGAGFATLADFDAALENNFERFHKRDFRMVFTTNHDENSWQGGDRDLYGDNFENMAVFAATVWGMPLIYNGQESGLNKQLEFFEKDEIEWGNYRYQDFYTTLLDINTRNQALFNGEIGGDFRKMATDKDEHIFAFKRIGHHEQVMTILNFSDEERTFNFTEGHEGVWTDIFEGTELEVVSPFTIGSNSFYLLERVYMSH
ncbi:MAG: alpha-glucosidase C-terminal domain-containing protein [Balneolaceae bacterium]|nr:alpha-glucosidase C-terminal domain-containing protein [Balneolaceae bacterium]